MHDRKIYNFFTLYFTRLWKEVEKGRYSEINGGKNFQKLFPLLNVVLSLLVISV
jgi:hypothetical protein